MRENTVSLNRSFDRSNMHLRFSFFEPQLQNYYCFVTVIHNIKIVKGIFARKSRMSPYNSVESAMRIFKSFFLFEITQKTLGK